MATVIHFDIGVEDISRAQNFYATLFGWKFQLLPGPTPYYLVETKDLAGAPALGGGMAKRSADQQPGITNFIGVESIDASLKKAKELGGIVIQEKQAVPGFGFMAVLKDPENNILGLFEEVRG